VAAYGVWLLFLYLDRLQDAWAKRASKAGAKS